MVPASASLISRAKSCRLIIASRFTRCGIGPRSRALLGLVSRTRNLTSGPPSRCSPGSRNRDGRGGPWKTSRFMKDQWRDVFPRSCIGTRQSVVSRFQVNMQSFRSEAPLKAKRPFWGERVRRRVIGDRFGGRQTVNFSPDSPADGRPSGPFRGSTISRRHRRGLADAAAVARLCRGAIAEPGRGAGDQPALSVRPD
jgi:hypothetical protein